MSQSHDTHALPARFQPLARGLALLHRGLDALRPLTALAARVYVAQVFFLAGVTKLRDWSSTLDLFAYEYQVPLLPPVLAAWLGTAGELILPILLVLGLGGFSSRMMRWISPYAAERRRCESNGVEPVSNS